MNEEPIIIRMDEEPLKLRHVHDVTDLNVRERGVSETPQFPEPFQQNKPYHHMVFLGRFYAEGTDFDLWYNLWTGHTPRLPSDDDSPASITAVHAKGVIHERACFWSKHAAYPELAEWAPGGELACEEADKRVRARKLPLYTRHSW